MSTIGLEFPSTLLFAYVGQLERMRIHQVPLHLPFKMTSPTSVVVIAVVFFGIGNCQRSDARCDPRPCVEKTFNIFLRQTPLLTAQEMERIYCNPTVEGSLIGLVKCWRAQCGEAAMAQDRVIQESVYTINQVCMNVDAKQKLIEGFAAGCQIFYPSPRALPVNPANLIQCMSPPGRAKRAIESKSSLNHSDRKYGRKNLPPSLVEMESGWQWTPGPLDAGVVPSPFSTGPGYGNQGIDEEFYYEWKWPTAFSSSVVSAPSYPMIFPVPATSAISNSGGQQDVSFCLETGELMDCTLSRTCSPERGKVMKSLALVYLSCSAIVRSTPVCDMSKVTQCMRISGGSVFDIFDVSRGLQYCQYYPAILNCITRDCPDYAVTNADMILLDRYKKFLINYCTDRQYQASVIKASASCPIFLNTAVLPITDASMMCSRQLVEAEGRPWNLCTLTEANTYCFAKAKNCDFSAVNPQKTALMEMIGCDPAGHLRYNYDAARENNATINRPKTALLILMVFIFARIVCFL